MCDLKKECKVTKFANQNVKHLYVDTCENVFARVCDNCKKGMNEGYAWDMGWACSDKCLYVDGYTKKQFHRDYEMDCIYYTEWDEVEVDEMYNKNGIQITSYIIDDNDKFITISNKEIK